MCSCFSRTVKYGFLDKPMQTNSIKLRTAPFSGHQGSNNSSKKTCSVNGVWCSVSRPIVDDEYRLVWINLSEFVMGISYIINLVHCQLEISKFSLPLSNKPFFRSNFSVHMTCSIEDRVVPICSMSLKDLVARPISQLQICQAGCHRKWVLNLMEPI